MPLCIPVQNLLVVALEFVSMTTHACCYLVARIPTHTAGGAIHVILRVKALCKGLEWFLLQWVQRRLMLPVM